MSSTTEQETVATERHATPPLQVLYCGVCTFPLEYCEFGSSLTRCKEWLNEAHPDLYPKYYSDEALQAKLGTLSLEAQSKLEKDTAKKEAKAEAKADAAKKKKWCELSQAFERQFINECRTCAGGIGITNVDLKKAAKLFATRFATGASVTKNAIGQDEIVVQGDVSQEIYDMMEEANEEHGAGGGGKGGKKGMDVLKGIVIENVDIVEEKKKKSTE
ncbi:hypothetical protein EW146_g8413 [Bondarzewia mesenterica]|uniref:SUI1 domain-containing protein n=1 Tax=Bondarzewia mesenterica TaxID=1095465 RepID=A0A4V3XDM3_9AGAM|nr:hypothetical protein EW146_g8413 [Bondarzewia mesenterica]